MTGLPAEPLSDFPSEDEWLSLPPPLIGVDFVERTWAAVQQDRRDQADEQLFADRLREPALPRELLAALQPPEPSTGFAARTAALVQRDRQDRLRSLLLRYVAPEPTPDFVARTLAALHQEHHRSLVQRSVWSAAVAAAAAALLLWARPWSKARPTSLQQAALVSAGPAFAPAFNPVPSTTLGAAFGRGRDPDALPLLAGDGLYLLAATAVTRR